ncbi:MAG: hypothetical protein SH817_14815 [Leptospira sp.]|nr:hypothetical protein [Leptospira sp.]
MKLSHRQLLLLLLNSLLFLSVVSIHAEATPNDREKSLDKEILSLYKDLSRAKELLGQQNIIALPNNTTISFIGKYPNRTGIIIKKFFIDTDPGNKSKVRSSEEKSILIEFNGSTLSKVEVSVISEDVQTQQKSKTKITDSTPLDDNLNDMVLSSSGIDGSNKFQLSELQNEGFKTERNDFKKDFYIKFLLDFHSQISSIIASQKERGTKNQQNMFKQLNGSLKY